MDSNRSWPWPIVGALALGLAVPATLAQTPSEERALTRPPERVVTRPDGTVIYPIVDEQETRRGTGLWRDRSVDAEERERRRLEAQRSAAERQELRMRERDAALENPARQIPPTIGR